MSGRAMSDEQLGEQRQHVVAAKLPGHQDRQAFPAELVDHHKHAESTAIMGTRLHEIVGPDMVTPTGPKTDAGAVVQPETAPLGLPLRHLQPFLTPDPGHALGIDLPAVRAQQRRDPPIAIAAILPCQVNDRFGERHFVVRSPGDMPLGRTRLVKNPARPSLRHTKPVAHVIHAATTTRSAQKFPDAASFRISLSSVRSATALRSCAFSRSSCFRRRAWSIFRPPYSLRQLMGWTALPPTHQAESLHQEGELQ